MSAVFDFAAINAAMNRKTGHVLDTPAPAMMAMPRVVITEPMHSVTDPGHTHAVTDPGYWHSFANPAGSFSFIC